MGFSRLWHLGALSGLGWDGIDWNGMVASLGQGANKEYFCAADYCFCQLWQKSSHERKSSSEGPPDHVMSVRGSEGQRVRGSEGFWKSGRAGQLGYKKVGFSQSWSLVGISPSQNHLNDPDMKTSVVLGLGLLLLAMASLTEAGCDQNGCCYCNSQTGRIINQGRYSTDCDPGFFCDCKYKERTRKFFGQCDDGTSSAAVAQKVGGGQFGDWWLAIFVWIIVWWKNDTQSSTEQIHLIWWALRIDELKYFCFSCKIFSWKYTIIRY